MKDNDSYRSALYLDSPYSNVMEMDEDDDDHEVASPIET